MYNIDQFYLLVTQYMLFFNNFTILIVLKIVFEISIWKLLDVPPWFLFNYKKYRRIGTMFSRNHILSHTNG